MYAIAASKHHQLLNILAALSLKTHYIKVSLTTMQCTLIIMILPGQVNEMNGVLAQDSAL